MTSDIFLFFFLAIVWSSIFLDGKSHTQAPTSANEAKNSNNGLDQPLILTPYIENGQIEEARSLSKVGRLPRVPSNIPSYSGFITVNKTYNSNMFFWFFPAMDSEGGYSSRTLSNAVTSCVLGRLSSSTTVSHVSSTWTFTHCCAFSEDTLPRHLNAPVILWLQGGPGGSGLFSLFVIHGPYIILENGYAELRQFTWAKEYHVIYVDNPVGTGFSFTGSHNGYVTNQNEVADDLYEFLRQFFLVYYEYSKNDFYITGMSYAGNSAR
ncbi:probable serine carboxypeptidase CPVL [Trichonephila clavipes]|nr:probable serine carboxypeptidase CPVL [Trichonephila clavipes]